MEQLSLLSQPGSIPEPLTTEQVGVIAEAIEAIGIARVMNLVIVAATIRKEEQIVLDMVQERLANRAL